MITAGIDVPINLPTNYNGADYLADSATFRVLGPGDAVIADWSAVPSSNITVGNIAITSVAANNALSTGNIKEARLIEVNVVAADTFAGPQRLTYDYVITQDVPPLVLMTNSFQTYTDSLALANDLAGELNTWPDATMDARCAAMGTAYNFLSRLNYEIYYDYDDVYFKTRASWGLPYQATVGRLYNYSPDQFLALDPDFILCIRKAQIVEADERLMGDSEESRRLSGIQSETIGPSNTVYRPGKPLDLMVGKRALRYLSGYIKFGVRTTRS